MTTGVKLLATTLSVIGGGGVIAPLTLWQTGYIGGSSSGGAVSSVQADSADSLEAKRVTQENSVSGTCEVVEKTKWAEILSGLKIEDKEYIVISCENTETVLKKWTGIFPNDVFSDDEELDINKSFDMKTETIEAPEKSDEKYRTIFSSRELHTNLFGEWGTEKEESVSKEGSKVYKVKEKAEGYDLIDSIYLVLPE